MSGAWPIPKQYYNRTITTMKHHAALVRAERAMEAFKRLRKEHMQDLAQRFRRNRSTLTQARKRFRMTRRRMARLDPAYTQKLESALGPTT